MNPPCPHTSDGEHKWVFTGYHDKADHYICLNAMCGQTKMELLDGEAL